MGHAMLKKLSQRAAHGSTSSGWRLKRSRTGWSA
jgi:hypothetical protein